MNNLRSLHVYPLWGFAVAQPLYSLIVQHPAFLSAHRLAGIELWLFVLVLSFLAPAGIWLLFKLVASVSTTAGKVIERLSVIALIALLGAGVATLTTSSNIVWLLVVTLFTALLSTAYFAVNAVRTFVSVLIPATLIFPLIFLTSESIRPYLGGLPDLPGLQERAGTNMTWTPAVTPHIVVLVFDELPVAAMLDTNGHIDESRFPHFAALSRDSVWFRDATTAALRTEMAIPALLTGRHPDKVVPPEASAYPVNLFTLLADSYQMKVAESVTRLCPPDLCSYPPSDALQFTQDLSYVFLHLVAPPAVRWRLPVIDRGWRDFSLNSIAGRAQALVKAGRREHARAFIREILNTPSPTMYFLHTDLPHLPYQYMPTGATLIRHQPLDALGKSEGFDVWLDDEAGVAEARAMFIWQLQFADTLLGELVARLRQENMYDETLLIVSSDHGVSIQPGELRRELTHSNAVDVLHVPLMVRDGMTSPRWDESNVQITDVLSIIASRLGVSGHSLERNPGDKKTVFTHTGNKTVDAGLLRKDSPAERWHFSEAGNEGNMVGRLFADLTEESYRLLGTGDYSLIRPEIYKKVDPSKAVPAVVRGVVNRADIESVLVVLNGYVAAIARPSTEDGSFAAFIDEHRYLKGTNQIELAGTSVATR